MRLLARAVLVIGTVAVGFHLFSAAPRDVVLVYDLPAPGGTSSLLQVELLRGGDLLRRSELSIPPGAGQVRHPVRLPDGEYVLHWRLSGTGAARGEATVEVHEDATIVLALRR